MTLKSRIEAVLFLTDKPLRAQAVARIVNEDVQVVRQMILELIHDYESRDTGVEISDDDGYIIQVKDEYASIIDEFVPMELPASLLRTLSAIAIKQPVPQSEIIKIRGAGAYDHIKELTERELINKKEDGRSPLLSTTKKFQEYFRLSQDGKTLRHELKTQLEELIAASPEEAAVAAAGTEQLSIAGITGSETPSAEGTVPLLEAHGGTIDAAPPAAAEMAADISAASEGEIPAETPLEVLKTESSPQPEPVAEVAQEAAQENTESAAEENEISASPDPTPTNVGEFAPGNAPQAFAGANEIVA